MTMERTEMGNRQRSFGFFGRTTLRAALATAILGALGTVSPSSAILPEEVVIGFPTPIFPPTKTNTPKPTPTPGIFVPVTFKPTNTPTPTFGKILPTFKPPNTPTPTFGIILPTFKPTNTPTPTFGIILPTLKPTNTPPIFVPPTFKPTNTPSPTPELPLCDSDADCPADHSCVELGEEFPGIAVCVPDPTPTPESTATAEATETATPEATATTTATAVFTATATWTEEPEIEDGCMGDCDQNGTVSIAELIRLVNMALEDPEAEPCESMDPEKQVSIANLVTAVNNSLYGCI